jgi:type I pantothenate kinase
MIANPRLFEVFGREAWAALRAVSAPSLSGIDITELVSPYQPIPLNEVADAYGPLGDLLHVARAAAGGANHARDGFLGRASQSCPYVIGVAGSVAAGKSTFARVLQAVLALGEGVGHVELVTTDGFLYPNAVLAERGLMRRKGFPESYDRTRMVDFLHAVKSGESQIPVPIYSHLAYDITGEIRQLSAPIDILIFEGLNVLQTSSSSEVVSDFFDFSIYLDAKESDIRRWFLQRFLQLKATAFQNPQSYFQHYKDLSDEQAGEFASTIWNEINLVNLRENIEPTRTRADVVFHKGPEHAMDEVWVRRSGMR